jgi:hypothetical protein
LQDGYEGWVWDTDGDVADAQVAADFVLECGVSAKFRELNCKFLCGFVCAGTDVDLVCRDGDFEVLPEPTAKGSVAVEAFGEGLGGTDKRLDVGSDSGEELSLCSVEVDGPEQDDFMIDLVDFSVFEGESSGGLHVPQTCFVKDVEVFALEFSKDLPTRFFGGSCKLGCNVFEVEQVGGEFTVE